MSEERKTLLKQPLQTNKWKLLIQKREKNFCLPSTFYGVGAWKKVDGGWLKSFTRATKEPNLSTVEMLVITKWYLLAMICYWRRNVFLWGYEKYKKHLEVRKLGNFWLKWDWIVRVSIFLVSFRAFSFFVLVCCFWTGTLVRRNFSRWQQIQVSSANLVD